MKFRMRAMTLKWVCLMSSLLPVAAWAQFQGAPASSKACLACHQVDTRRVGPPLRSVAEAFQIEKPGRRTLNLGEVLIALRVDD